MVFVTCFEKLEKHKTGVPDLGGQRTFGYYADWPTAIKAMHINNCDIRECVYNYGLLEEIDEGLYSFCSKRIFFKWDEDKKGFYEIDEPEFVEHFTNFSIG